MGFAGDPANHYRCKHRRLMNPVYWRCLNRPTDTTRLAPRANSEYGY
jgi:hypothetical protein